jgi:hypothetical protein
MEDGPRFLAIKNWERYQGGKMKNRVDEKRSWVKDYTDKEADPEYIKMTFFQRYVLDGCCRLRGRLGKNLPNDPQYIARALHAARTERAHLPHTVDTLIARGFLILTNQQFTFPRIEEIREEKIRGGDLGSSIQPESETKANPPRPDNPAFPIGSRTSEPTPKTDPVPEGLSVYQFARGMMDALGVPGGRSDLEIWSQAIALKAKNAGTSLAAAYEFIFGKAKAAKDRGEFTRPTFWMRDATYDHDGIVPKSRASRAADDYLRRRGHTA